MRPPLIEWTADYILSEVEPHREQIDIEKKAAAVFDVTSSGKPSGSFVAEMAKQVCAFANAGGGFIALGIDENTGVDVGLPSSIGNQPIADWFEFKIPQLLTPPITGCQAAFIIVPERNADGRGVVIVEVPSSEHRPHWATDANHDRAYIRAGAHSLPMRHQTLLDISARGRSTAAEIQSLDMTDRQTEHELVIFRTRPAVQLLSGTVCEKWSFEVKFLHGDGEMTHSVDIPIRDSRHLYWVGATPLFPHRITRASEYHTYLRLRKPLTKDSHLIEFSLFTSDAPPVRRRYGAIDLLGMAPKT